MGSLVFSASPALWVPGCLALLLWLWVLCTARHRKRAQRQPAVLQGSVRPAETVSSRLLSPGQGGASRALTCLPCPQSTLRQPHLSVLSKSDTRLHEVHRGPHRAAPRPASMDLLRPACLEVSRGSIRPPAAFAPQEPPQPSPAATHALPAAGPEATYSNVGLAAIPRASLAASPTVWAGARLTSSRARPEVAAYARIQRLKGADWGPQGPEQGKAQGTPAAQADVLYSRVNKPKRRDPGPAVAHADPRGQAAVLTLGRNLSYEALPLRGPGVDQGDDGSPENVYESIQDMGIPRGPAAPSSGD
ncbi:lck-interacting transmembrane adapter 1 [Pteronotus mesoamericanus]|uniref:lck-interacting transmembrane adapter 1 n=1 Tax=Pteronotus mesoamericanus TaxID=1884717 RepID=UPI0023ED02FF|nr:lck-interacting transmembrane adapter 1 [Pteronotus parnellii mesoamericanus]